MYRLYCYPCNAMTEVGEDGFCWCGHSTHGWPTTSEYITHRDRPLSAYEMGYGHTPAKYQGD